MAKRKKTDTPPKPPQFRTTPFSALKGVAVAAPVQSQTPAAETAVAPVTLADEADIFLQAMAGVERMNGGQSAARKPASGSGGTAKSEAASPITGTGGDLERAERQAFARAIASLKLDVTFSDGTPADEELKPLGGNRLRQLKRGIISVERQLDLHGLTREEALEELPRFLRSASAHGEQAVLVITGKGNNSPAEPVLQQAVAGWLRDAGRKLVKEFVPAPREMGGSGAFVVFMRKQAASAPVKSS